MKRSLYSKGLIGIGILIIAYPYFLQGYRTYQQKQLLMKWEESMQRLETLNEKELPFEEPEQKLETDQTQKSLKQIEEEKEERVELPEGAESLLEIEKIELKLPVLSGATTENLNISAASLEGTGEAGKLGNYAIAGHRSHTYGRNFNRLDELEQGDLINLTTAKKHYTYQIKEKLYVMPEEVWVLEGKEDVSELTLITCHPMIQANQRLIIKAVLIEGE